MLVCNLLLKGLQPSPQSRDCQACSRRMLAQIAITKVQFSDIFRTLYIQFVATVISSRTVINYRDQNNSIAIVAIIILILIVSICIDCARIIYQILQTNQVLSAIYQRPIFQRLHHFQEICHVNYINLTYSTALAGSLTPITTSACRSIQRPKPASGIIRRAKTSHLQRSVTECVDGVRLP